VCQGLLKNVGEGPARLNSLKSRWCTLSADCLFLVFNKQKDKDYIGGAIFPPDSVKITSDPDSLFLQVTVGSLSFSFIVASRKELEQWTAAILALTEATFDPEFSVVTSPLQVSIGSRKAVFFTGEIGQMVPKGGNWPSDTFT
jgi:hypothetical protein